MLSLHQWYLESTDNRGEGDQLYVLLQSQLMVFKTFDRIFCKGAYEQYKPPYTIISHLIVGIGKEKQKVIKFFPK